MKQQKFTTARTIFLALTLAVMVAVPTATARAQSSEIDHSATQSAAQGGGLLDVLEQIKLAQSQALEGSWLLTISPAVPPGVPQPLSFPGNVSFSRGGVAFGADPRRSSRQFGSWVHQRGVMNLPQPCGRIFTTRQGTSHRAAAIALPEAPNPLPRARVSLAIS